VADENSLPVDLRVAPGGEHDLYACGTILNCIPKHSVLTCDRGYDAQWFRKKIRQKKIKPVIPKRQWKNKKRRMPSPVTYKGRWVVERCFAWMEKFRKLAIRYEYKSSHYQAFWQLGSAVLILQKITG
jgi:transposase